MKRIAALALISGTLLLLGACKKDKVVPDERLDYIGKWNFATYTSSYSGYYNYNVPPGTSPNWVSTYSSSVTENDSTGSITLGPGKDQLIVKFCETCDERIYDLKENGQKTWYISPGKFIDEPAPPPGGYSSSYYTNKTEGQKL